MDTTSHTNSIRTAANASESWDWVRTLWSMAEASGEYTPDSYPWQVAFDAAALHTEVWGEG
jgi:hypothetical protein